MKRQAASGPKKWWQRARNLPGAAGRAAGKALGNIGPRAMSNSRPSGKPKFLKPRQ